MGAGHQALCLLLFAVLVRLLVGLHPYSGQATPPRFGDYEAQRHWMEIAVNVPVRSWYTNSTDNDLHYWGLDYPPLSGYQSWLHGKALQLAEPGAMTLRASHGYETPSSKALMRWTVVLSDLVCYMPAAWAAAHVFGGHESPGRHALAATMLLNPALVIMDHGHFQYNGISLGLAAAAAAAVGSGHNVMGSVLYCLSLNHKQMSLYYAPAFFAYLLGVSLGGTTPAAKVAAVARLGVAVLGSFAVLWLPYLGSAEAALGVLRRIFPTKRGLYEDYVANFWCVSSLVIKWKRVVAPGKLVRVCTLATLLAFLPSMVWQLRDTLRTRLVISMAISALSFYLFSFQVHEKSILLPLLPITILSGRHSTIFLVILLPAMAVLSMVPLLAKDGLLVASVAVLTIYMQAVRVQCATQAMRIKTSTSPMVWVRKVVIGTSIAGMILLTVLFIAIPPPAQWPYLWDALIMAWAFPHFLAAFMYLHTL